MSLIASDKQRVVIGLGPTGLSCARHLAARGLPFAVMDSRAQPPALAAFRAEFAAVPLHLGGFDAALLSTAGELIVSPGVALEEPAIAAAMRNGVPVCGDIDLFVRALADEQPAPALIAITGSNGKSTVTTLVGEMAKAAGRRVGVGGNLGTPALELLGRGSELYVLELSSFQLERSQPLGATVATVLNVSADHLDRYPDLPAYHRAKHRVFHGCKQVVVNRADPLSQPLLAQGVTQWTFGLDAPDFKGFGVRERGGERFLAFEQQELLPLAQLRILGEHNIANALAALALGHAAGLPLAAMLEALRNFTGLPHRCQRVAESGGVRFYDDSKGTNVGATVAAIAGLSAAADAGRGVLIAGGVGKGADFAALAPALRQRGRAAVLIGAAAADIEAVLRGVVPLARAANMAEAVAQAAEFARPGDSVLLSPACASIDMFDNYALRGDVFTAAARALAGGR
jgi:UDP-N-acetylmuramoylalanine--D-glutamate ligase